MAYDQPFNRLDLQSERISIFRDSDGGNLGNVVTDDFTLAQKTFALSPAGNALALLGKNSIRFYSVKPSN